jgi:heme oxygenase
MFMKRVVYSSRTRGFDGQILVVRTVNKLPHAKRLLVLEQSLDLALVDQGLDGIITRQALVHKLHALFANLKRLVREKLSLTLPVGLLAFHLASEVEKWNGF